MNFCFMEVLELSELKKMHFRMLMHVASKYNGLTFLLEFCNMEQTETTT